MCTEAFFFALQEKKEEEVETVELSSGYLLSPCYSDSTSPMGSLVQLGMGLIPFKDVCNSQL